MNQDSLLAQENEEQGLGTNEILAMLRFGANAVLSADDENAPLTDADIEILIDRSPESFEEKEDEGGGQTSAMEYDAGAEQQKHGMRSFEGEDYKRSEKYTDSVDVWLKELENQDARKKTSRTIEVNGKFNVILGRSALASGLHARVSCFDCMRVDAIAHSPRTAAFIYLYIASHLYLPHICVFQILLSRPSRP